MDDMYFEDFDLGQTFETGSVIVTEDDIVDFGKRFANLPYHTDPVAAKDTAFGGLVAAGYQTASITFGLVVELGVFSAGGMGSPGIDKLRWLRPVRPGDTLRVRTEIVELSPAKTAPGRDAIRIAYDTVNQNGETVMTLTSLHFIHRRPTPTR